MDKLTRWGKVIKCLRLSHIPFLFIRKARITTKNNIEYVGTNDVEVQKILENIKKSENSDLIQSMNVEMKDRKFKKEVRKYTDSLFQRYFPTKSR